MFIEEQAETDRRASGVCLGVFNVGKRIIFQYSKYRRG
jgi:hypothetical protein